MSKKRIQPQQRNEAWKAFSVVMAAGFVGLLSVSIVNVALPSIEKSLHATPTQFQWIVAGYAVAFGLLLVPSGRFGDVLGRRPVFLFGSLLFMLTLWPAVFRPALEFSLLCACYKALEPP